MSRGPHRSRRQTDLVLCGRLSTVAAEFGGVLTPADAASVGATRDDLLRLMRSGNLRRLQRGVYVDADRFAATRSSPREAHLLRAAAVLRTLRQPAALTHVSALVAYGLPVPDDGLRRVHLWRPAGVDQRGGRQALASSSSRGALASRVVGNLIVVHPALAAAHAACTLDDGWALVAGDAVLGSGMASSDQFDRALQALSSFRGHARAARVVASARAGAESPLESLSRLAFLQRGVPEPRLQVAFFDERGFVGRADMLFDEWRVIGEADGLGKYGSHADLVSEKVREDRLRDLGFEVVRWTWDDIHRRPDAVVAQLHRARDRAARRYG